MRSWDKIGLVGEKNISNSFSDHLVPTQLFLSCKTWHHGFTFSASIEYIIFLIMKNHWVMKILNTWVYMHNFKFSKSQCSDKDENPC